MSDSERLIEQLRRSNRRWKTLALAACATLVLWGLIGLWAAARQRIRAEAALREANEALARANLAAPNPGPPR